MLSFCSRSWSPDDFVFYYSEKGNGHYKQSREWELFLVYTPPLPPPSSSSTRRRGSCFVRRKGHSTPPDLEMEKNSFEITSFDTTNDLLSLFQRYESFYSYDPYTYLSNLAVLCGCTSIVIPIPHVPKSEWVRLRGPYGHKGIAYGVDDIDNARREIENGDPWTHIRHIGYQGMKSVERFARFCANSCRFPISFHRLPEFHIDQRSITDLIVHGVSSRLYDRLWTNECLSLLSARYPEWNIVLTSSATHALDAIAILLDLKQGDEVIVPSFSFSSTANAFSSHGATIVFADSLPHHPNIDTDSLPDLLSSKTRAVVLVYYGGHAVNDIDPPFPSGVVRVDDASHCIGQDVSPEADFVVFSLHTTKNISTCGEGGVLMYRSRAYSEQISHIIDKGTNCATTPLSSSYEWVSHGSAFRMPEIGCLFLYPQLKNLDRILHTRRSLVDYYMSSLSLIPDMTLPDRHTGHHIFFISTPLAHHLIHYLSRHGVDARQHYTPLHQSSFINSTGSLPNSEHWARSIVRLPLHTFLTFHDIDMIASLITRFYEQHALDSRTRQNPLVQT
jgi:dTDP-4-amino-4,6-dideoxygalactose transaminase